MRMMASLECADPNLRRMIQQGAMNCSEQAYEVWQYMNQKGYYQVPTMKDMTTQTMIQSYAEGNTSMGMNTQSQQTNYPNMTM
jgi:spore coat protein CotF